MIDSNIERLVIFILQTNRIDLFEGYLKFTFRVIKEAQIDKKHIRWVQKGTSFFAELCGIYVFSFEKKKSEFELHLFLSLENAEKYKLESDVIKPFKFDKSKVVLIRKLNKEFSIESNLSLAHIVDIKNYYEEFKNTQLHKIREGSGTTIDNLEQSVNSYKNLGDLVDDHYYKFRKVVFVEDEKDIRDNYNQFLTYKNSSNVEERGFYKKRIKSGGTYIIDIIDGKLEFAPSRMMGYKNLCRLKYEPNIVNGIDGGQTNNVIQKIIGKRAANKRIDRALKKFLENQNISKSIIRRKKDLHYFLNDELELKIEPFLKELISNNKKSTSMQNVKNIFINWLIKNPRSNYFNNDKIILNQRLDTYNDLIDQDIFTVSKDSYKDIIKLIKEISFDEENKFFKFSEKDSTHRPRAILGRENYCKFLNEYYKKSDKPLKPFGKLNQILYGPPGTGKTYSTIVKALSIIENKKEEVLALEERKKLKERFNEYVLKEQIVFSTFHQSMSYEDFVEGIKPIEPEKEGEQVIYKVVDGIFKQICVNAKTPNQNGFEQAFDLFIKKHGENDNLLKLKTPSNKEFGIKFNRNNNLNLHTGESLNKQGVLTRENLKKQINGEDKFEGWDGYFKSVVEYLKLEFNYSEKDSTLKPYILIIDEINRGNVSQIFGELITLIEENKRTGSKNIEALKIKLPYSKEQFSVPNNLHIIGTMNTADRSVEALDSALRRRFSFQEMMPKPKLLSPQQMIVNLWNHPDYFEVKWEDKAYRNKADALYSFLGTNKAYEKLHYNNEELRKWELNDLKEESFNGFNLQNILETINNRIEVLIDRDHTIGHSYFMGLELKDNIEEALKLVFKDKIIPLLQEYFFNDYGKIQLVLGEGFVEKIEHKKDLFHKVSGNDIEVEEYLEKPSYNFTIENEKFELENALKILLNGKKDTENSKT